jgi:3',5'-cyclic-AMP phosphodiesterase
VDRARSTVVAARRPCWSRTVPQLSRQTTPVGTAFLQCGDLRGSIPDNGLVVENAREVVDLLLKYNTKALLQGHTHICEKAQYKGCQFVTTGAVCGDWWKGPRLGFPNGFRVATAAGGTIEFEYVAY